MFAGMIGQCGYAVNRAAARAEFYRDEQDKRDRQDMFGFGSGLRLECDRIRMMVRQAHHERFSI